jgi:aminopyrrolnitrin oxygenase
MNEASERLNTGAVAALPIPLPDWPPGWYAVARASELPPGAVRAVKLGDSEIVLFRTKQGVIGALDAHCPHMGAHLVHGRVAGEHLLCALHCWRIGVDGKIAGHAEHTRAWPVREVLGLVVIELGTGANLPVAGEAQFAWIGIKPHDIAVPWHALMVNAFDMPHLCTVHQRQLISGPDISVDPGRSFTLHYVSRVTGRGLSDRLMKLLSGNRIDVRMTCYGTILVCETDLGFTRTAGFIGMLPTEQGTRVNAAFGVRPGPLLVLRLVLTRWLFAAFLRRDLEIVEGMRLRTGVNDATLQSLFDFLRGLRRARR